MPYSPNNNPYIPGDPYSYDLKWMVDRIHLNTTATTAAQASADAAQASADAAQLTANAGVSAAAAAQNTANAGVSAAAAAQNTANNALTTANSATDKLAKSPVYELLYDVANSEITLTNLDTGEVLSSENDPMQVYKAANIMFGREIDSPPISGDNYLYTVMPKMPEVRFVYKGLLQTAWVSKAIVAYRGLSGLRFLIQDADVKFAPATLLIGAAADNLVFANSSYHISGLPEVSASNNGYFMLVDDGEWKLSQYRNSRLVLENGELNASWGALKAMAISEPSIPWLYYDNPSGTPPLDDKHISTYIFADAWYDDVQQNYKASFIGYDSRTSTGVTINFYSDDQHSNMTQD